MKTFIFILSLAALSGCAHHGPPDFHGCNPRGENYGPTQEKLNYWAQHPDRNPRK